MLNRIEQIMEKILPDLARGAKNREEATESVVKKSKDARKKSEDAMFEAYRKAGVAVAGVGSHRRWED